MAYRRILFTLTALSALLLVGSLGLVVHARSDRTDQPVRIELSQALMASLDRLNERVDGLVAMSDLAGLRQARQDLAQVVLTFDQDLLALSETVRDGKAAGTINDIQTIWNDLGLGLADLAAGEYVASSAAGRQTVELLRRETPAMRRHLQATATALHGAENRARSLGSVAATGAAILGGLTLLLGLAASRPPRMQMPEHASPQGDTGADKDRTDKPRSAFSTFDGPAGDLAPAGNRYAGTGRPAAPFEPHGDLGLAGAAVDRVTMDMGTVARSAERMQQAVDSVASALQGMLFSLNEMSQDTFEGSRLTRTAHNSAIYAADTARELIESARDMGAVVARVRALAARSQEIAGRIEADAAATGATGKAFTSVVAQEVKQLAAATGDATARIEATVDGILAGQRQYEEAIGQIIKNIGAVRKVAASMSELMLAPPMHVQPGAQYAAAPAPAPPGFAAAAGPPPPTASDRPAAAEPETAESEVEPFDPSTDVLDDFDQNDQLPDPAETVENAENLAAATSDLLDELADVAAETTAQSAPAAAVEEAPPPAAEAKESTAKPGGSNGNVFMLKRSPKKKVAPEAAPAPAPAEPEAAAEPAAEPEPEAAPAPAEPEATAEPATTQPEDTPEEADLEPAGAAAGPGKPRPAAQGASGNIFMLNKPKKS